MTRRAIAIVASATPRVLDGVLGQFALGLVIQLAGRVPDAVPVRLDTAGEEVQILEVAKASQRSPPGFAEDAVPPLSARHDAARPARRVQPEAAHAISSHHGRASALPDSPHSGAACARFP